MNHDDQPIIPTPPVIETGQQPDANWNGVDRRRTNPLTLAIEHATARVNNAPVAASSDRVIAIVVLGAALALLCLVLISQFRLADRVHDAEIEQRRFRESVVCFLVESTRARASTGVPSDPAHTTDILTTCGFINIPGNGK